MEKNKNTYESYNETVEEFKNSFSYGSRNNLFFKYLGGKNISENEFTIFIEELPVSYTHLTLPTTPYV